ncbi:flagellar basal body rod protein [Paenibacillus darwinianus]|uniref:Flagellar basal body rod protein n=1 Tax=Paenibacillus darwinianus TaxID=1380763 RepID=A0A9W5RZV6_9BACL|nr:flagellar hook-basal body protein [Paenibacillus darwinianus]EXX85635.1 flagellar basal body rod protein [Paenibacillus darwinianus]EXX85648.1 flagellar basal body rod protein [Paenibacillus darwinianus]EXX88852.1 flagellar basal body rod protein [Paenibacillus darwinianus]
MLRGLYTAAAGMITQQRRHDTVTNNISNANTPGFKQVNAISRSFPDMLLSLTGAEGDKSKPIGILNTGVFAEESLSIYAQGDLSDTGRASDFAIMSDIEVPGLTFDDSGKAVAANGDVTFQPQAFFTIQDRNGQERYSRDGTFTLNEEGFLVTSDGSFVLGTNNAPIQFEPGTAIENLTLTRGQRFVDSRTGLDTGRQLLISLVENPNRLVREGNSKFRLDDPNSPVRPVNANDRFEVRQGFIERSNIDSAQSMVDLMSALRAYESNQKMVQYYDESLRKAVTEIGRI